MQPGTKTHVQSQEGVKNLPAGPQAGVLLFKVHAIEIGANLGDCSLWLAAASMQLQIMTKTIPLWSHLATGSHPVLMLEAKRMQAVPSLRRIKVGSAYSNPR